MLSPAEEVARVGDVGVQQRGCGILRIKLAQDGVVLAQHHTQRLHAQASAVDLSEGGGREGGCGGL